MRNAALAEESLTPPVMPIYARADLRVARGEGAYLYDEAGRRYLDFAAGIAVNCLGHAHPKLIEALHEQAQKIWHCSNIFHIPGQEVLAKKLTDHSFADTVFFTNSGAEAVECSIKVARKYHHENGAPERYRLITF